MPFLTANKNVALRSEKASLSNSSELSKNETTSDFEQELDVASQSNNRKKSDDVNTTKESRDSGQNETEDNASLSKEITDSAATNFSNLKQTKFDESQLISVKGIGNQDKELTGEVLPQGKKALNSAADLKLFSILDEHGNKSAEQEYLQESKKLANTNQNITQTLNTKEFKGDSKAVAAAQFDLASNIVSNLTGKSQENSLSGQIKNNKFNDIKSKFIAHDIEGNITSKLNKFGFDSGLFLKNAKLLISENNLKDLPQDLISNKFNSELITANDNRINQLFLSQAPHMEPLRAETQQMQLSLRVNEPLNNMSQIIDRFAPAMKQQLMTMINQGIHQAELKIDPPELGQILVRIMVTGEQTQVHFNAQQNNTREMLEQALPKLKEMLSEQGMQLADGQVSQQKEQQGNNQNNNRESLNNYKLDADNWVETSVNLTQLNTKSKGIDFYA